MLPFASEFTPLERAVMAAICEMHAEDRQVLEAQLLTAIFGSRENTGAGFFLNFDVNRDQTPAIAGERLRNGPQAQIAVLSHGMGFILWLKDGYAHQLEGYTYDDSTVGMDLGKIDFQLI
jgi:hypothetical protein